MTQGIMTLDGRPRVRLRLLDRFELRIDGEVTQIQPAGQRLLALLALANASVDRAFAASQLWPDTDEDRAKANLRSAIWRIRRLPCGLLRPAKHSVTLLPTVWVDARDGLRELSAGVAGDLLDDDHFCAVLRDDLLPDWYDDWLVIERERVRQLRLHAMERYALGLIACGRAAEAIQAGLRGVAMDPLRESAHRVVVTAHLAEDNVAEALSAYLRCVDLLARELGVAPSATFTGLVEPWLGSCGHRIGA